MQKQFNLLRLLIKRNALQLPCYLFSSLVEAFGNIGEFRAKKYFTDLQLANRIHLVGAIKGDFSGIIFFF